MPAVSQSIRTFFALAVAVSALAAVTGAPAVAQVNTAVIDAQVADSRGMPLRNVIVRATNTDSGIIRETGTADDGTARLSAIPPGSYDVSFHFQDGASLVQQNVVVAVGQTVVLQATRQAP